LLDCLALIQFIVGPSLAVAALLSCSSVFVVVGLMMPVSFFEWFVESYTD
jgi:hypothetical protein